MTKSRAEILGSPFDPPSKTVDIPGWGEISIIPVSPMDKRLIRFANRPLEVEKGPGGRPRFEEPSDEERQARRLTAKVILGVVGPEGEPVFTFDDEDTLRSARHWEAVSYAAMAITDFTAEVEHGTADEPALEAAKND